MKIDIKKLSAALVDPGHIKTEKFNEALEEANEQNIAVEDVLVAKELITEENINQVIAEVYGFKYINFLRSKIDDNILNLIPELVARNKEVVAFSRTDKGVKIAMRDPNDLETINAVRKRVGDEVEVYYISKSQFNNALRKYKAHVGSEVSQILSQLESKEYTIAEKESMVVKLLDLIIKYAFHNQASDIHLEPYRQNMLIRFRIDGVLHDFAKISKSLHDLMVSRIKILARMRTDEHRAAQDGKIRFQADDDVFDIRVSIVPITEGENVVMRILAESGKNLSLSSLGLGEGSLKKVNKAIKKPYGMILTTGPTGSGKTTTLYAILKILNKREVHISTIEDPVEYDIEGVSQIQVNTRTNLTFAKGLRAIVRQDPDIILIGEIRDNETASIAVNSAMTGHLVLSSLHTNDAATAIPRLLDMKIDPFLIASTVNIVIAQRLVRKICDMCIKTHEITREESGIIDYNENIKKYFFNKGFKGNKFPTLYEGKGCSACSNTGYRGRIGIFEVMELNDELRELILKKSPSNIIAQKAREKGMKTILEDGLDKVLDGMTTFGEVIRVAGE